MFQGIFPYLARGIPEMGVQHFEPLLIDAVHVSKGGGSLTLAGSFKNLVIKGPSNTTVRSARWGIVLLQCGDSSACVCIL